MSFARWASKSLRGCKTCWRMPQAVRVDRRMLIPPRLSTMRTLAGLICPMGNKFEATVRRAAIGMALIKGTGFLTASMKSKRRRIPVTSRYAG